MPSRGWSGVQDIVSNGSVDLFRSLFDPIGNSWLVSHLYGDVDNSGTKTEFDMAAVSRFNAAVASGVPIALTEVGAYDTPLCRRVIVGLQSIFKSAANIKAKFWWSYARWFGDAYLMALRKQDGTATRLFHCLTWTKAVCPYAWPTRVFLRTMRAEGCR